MSASSEEGALTPKERSPAQIAAWPPAWGQVFLSWTERTLSLAQVVVPLVLISVALLGFRPEWLELVWEAAVPIMIGLAILLVALSGHDLWREGRRALSKAQGWSGLGALAPGASGRSALAIAGDDVFRVSRGERSSVGKLSELTRVEVLPPARGGLLGWRKAWPSQTLRLVWVEPAETVSPDSPPTEGEGIAAEADAVEAEASPPSAPLSPTSGPEEEGVAESGPREESGEAPEGESVAESGSLSEGEPEEATEPEEQIRHAETFELASWSVEPFLRWVALEAAREVRDPAAAYPDVAAARASRGVELFWPPPRRAALRYFAGFAVTIIGVCALPAGLLLMSEAKRAPGLIDFGDHVIWMARPVGEAALLLVCGAVFLTALQVSFLRVKVLRAARRFSLPPGERLLALCYARTRLAWPPPPEPEPEPDPESEESAEGEEAPTQSSEDEEGTPPVDSTSDEAEGSEPEAEKVLQGPVAAGAPWGEFVAITDRRILQLLFGEGRNHVLEVCQREDLLALAHLAPASHPLLTVLRHLRSDGRGLRLWTADGRELRITSEVLFHGSLVSWLEAAGHRIEDWGYLPLELPGWIRSPSDPRRAELEAPEEPPSEGAGENSPQESPGEASAKGANLES